jgi:hypothetical protein
MENEMYRQKAENITNRRNLSSKSKIDALLELNADQYCNLGTDSPKSERSSAEATSRFIYRKIKEIDVYLGSFLLKFREE